MSGAGSAEWYIRSNGVKREKIGHKNKSSFSPSDIQQERDQSSYANCSGFLQTIVVHVSGNTQIGRGLGVGQGS